MTHRDLDSILRQAVMLGTLAVLLVPAARGSSELVGWWPLWLVGMPRRRRAQARRRPVHRTARPVQAARRA